MDGRLYKNKLQQLFCILRVLYDGHRPVRLCNERAKRDGHTSRPSDDDVHHCCRPASTFCCDLNGQVWRTQNRRFFFAFLFAFFYRILKYLWLYHAAACSFFTRRHLRNSDNLHQYSRDQHDSRASKRGRNRLLRLIHEPCDGYWPVRRPDRYDKVWLYSHVHLVRCMYANRLRSWLFRQTPGDGAK
ncbi:hypothetical protein D3C78_907670 [compost metagenome]